MFTEDDLLPISALQHLAYCPRQWALIHLEQVWSDNRLTAEGSQMHERAHDEEIESRGDLRIARGLRLRSLRLGLVGQVDVIEFHKIDNAENGLILQGVQGFWQPVVIEYKRGRPKIGHEDEVQLCAQCLCLEEMLGVHLSLASFFYGQPRRRYDLILSPELRQETETLIALLHDLTLSGKTPIVDYTPKCRNCSLASTCLPGAVCRHKKVSEYISRTLQAQEELDEEAT